MNYTLPTDSVVPYIFLIGVILVMAGLLGGK